MARIPSARPLLEHERPRQRSLHESLDSIQSDLTAKARKRNWQPPKDRNEFYRRNGSAFAAKESAETAAKRYDPHGND